MSYSLGEIPVSVIPISANEAMFYSVASYPVGWESWNWRKQKKYIRNGWFNWEWNKGTVNG